MSPRQCPGGARRGGCLPCGLAASRRAPGVAGTRRGRAVAVPVGAPTPAPPQQAPGLMSELSSGHSTSHRKPQCMFISTCCHPNATIACASTAPSGCDARSLSARPPRTQPAAGSPSPKAREHAWASTASSRCDACSVKAARRGSSMPAAGAARGRVGTRQGRRAAAFLTCSPKKLPGLAACTSTERAPIRQQQQRDY